MTERSQRPPGEGSAFSLPGVRRGYLARLPVAVGVAGYGVAGYGALARRAGLSAFEATLMSATVLAGGAQLVAVELWASSATVPIVAIAATTLVLDRRYVLLGAALRP